MQVSLKYCDEYELQKVKTVIKQSIDSLGGLTITPNETILIKPNLLTRKKPEDAATTHPVVVHAVAEILIEQGAKVVIGDSPGGPFSPMYVNSVYKATGMTEVAEKTGAMLNENFEGFDCQNPKGKLLKKIRMVSMVEKIDKIICIAKLKTHGMMTYTGAVKNMFGLIPGVAKAEFHLNMPDYEDFSDALIDICLAKEPILSIIDGIVGMEGNGPGSGTPVNSNVIFMSKSPYHLDMAACNFIGLSIQDVPMLRKIEERGLARLEEIKYIGDANFNNKPYKLPESKGSTNKTSVFLPSFIKKFLARFVQTRPLFNLNTCNGCQVCKENCPAKIIKMVNNKPNLDYKDCIRCYCCQELCPRMAITIKRPRLSKILRL